MKAKLPFFKYLMYLYWIIEVVNKWQLRFRVILVDPLTKQGFSGKLSALRSALKFLTVNRVYHSIASFAREWIGGMEKVHIITSEYSLFVIVNAFCEADFIPQDMRYAPLPHVSTTKGVVVQCSNQIMSASMIAEYASSRAAPWIAVRLSDPATNEYLNYATVIYSAVESTTVGQLIQF